jgi:phospholipid/cholesterol/gamma-HCH transport system substrate-binding protein
MDPRPGEHRIHPRWWTLILAAAITAFLFTTSSIFVGAFRSFIPVTLTSDRSGLVMESSAKVKMRGVVVGRVAGIVGGSSPVRLKLEIDPDMVKYIPTNVGAQIRASTTFGAKFVDLIYPAHPSSERLKAGAVLTSSNVSTEVNTVFQNVVDVLKQIKPDKLNAVLTAISDGVRGRGEQIGQAITDTNQILTALNARSETIRDDLRAATGFGDAYSTAAQDISHILDTAATTSTTITNQQSDLDALLLNAIGLAHSGTDILGATGKPLTDATTILEPTTALLLKYSPSNTCMLLGGERYLDHSARESVGGNGYSSILDLSITLANDQYRYPDNLPKVAAKGGPGGKPSCGSLPDVGKAYPVQYTVTNTGWGTGLDLRPNPGIAHPWWVNFLPTTRAVPEPPSIRGAGPPAIGPIPYPGAPPYGAPLFGPDGSPLWAPPPPGAPPPPIPGVGVAPPPYGPGPTAPQSASAQPTSAPTPSPPAPSDTP